MTQEDFHVPEDNKMKLFTKISSSKFKIVHSCIERHKREKLVVFLVHIFFCQGRSIVLELEVF